MSRVVFAYATTDEEAKEAVDLLVAKGYPREEVDVLTNHPLGPAYTDTYKYVLRDRCTLTGYDAAAWRSYAADPRHRHYYEKPSTWLELRNAVIYDRHRGNLAQEVSDHTAEILDHYQELLDRGGILVVVDDHEQPEKLFAHLSPEHKNDTIRKVDKHTQ